MSGTRYSREIKFTWASGQTLSDSQPLGFGAFGTILVPAGSALIGKSLQFVAVSESSPAKFSDTDLLTTPITLAAGANVLTEAQLREVAAVGLCKLKVNSAAGSDSSLVLLWKA